VKQEVVYLDVKRDVFAFWPGRCALCRRVWWSECIHPDPKAGRGHFKSVRQRWIPRWLRPRKNKEKTE